jgi:hypothetical protein
MPDGKLSVSVHALRKEPELDKYYFGIKFTDEDKQNFLKTGNLGRVAEAEYRHKTQVAVNSEGKTENVKEPLQKGQTQPTEKQI